MFDAFWPPMPSLAPLFLWLVVAGLLVAGMAMTFWGRVLGRGLLMVALGIVGMLQGGALAAWLGLPLANSGLWHLLLSFILIVIAFGAERLIWGLLAAAGLCAIALQIALPRMLASGKAVAKVTGDAAKDPTLTEFLLARWSSFTTTFTAAWNDHSGTLVAILCAVSAVPLLLGIVRPRLMRILMTCLLGAAAVVLAAALALATLQPTTWTWLWQHPYILAAAVAVLFVPGMIVQYRAAMKADASEDKRESEPPPPRPAKGKPSQAQ